MKAMILAIFLVFMLWNCNSQNMIDKKGIYYLAAYNEGDRQANQGTGFVLQTDGSYFLVTCSHVFLSDGQPLLDLRIPTPDISKKTLKMFADGDLSKEPVHKQELISSDNKLEYSVYILSLTQALDLTVMKLNNPSEAVRKNSFSIEIIEDRLTTELNSDVTIVGFPSASRVLYEYTGKLSKDQFSSPSKKAYFFNLTNEKKLSGASGAPIFQLVNNEWKILGVFIAQAQTFSPPVGMANYAHYILELVNQINRSR